MGQTKNILFATLLHTLVAVIIYPIMLYTICVNLRIVYFPFRSNAWLKYITWQLFVTLIATFIGIVPCLYLRYSSFLTREQKRKYMYLLKGGSNGSSNSNNGGMSMLSIATAYLLVFSAAFSMGLHYIVFIVDEGSKRM